MTSTGVPAAPSPDVVQPPLPHPDAAPPQQPDPKDPASHADRARSFESGAQGYRTSRPSYPAAAVSWLLGGDGTDLGSRSILTVTSATQDAPAGVPVATDTPSPDARRRPDRLAPHPRPLHVLDLGAGTGKLTELIAATGASVVAVEPSAAMRAELSALVPGIDALDGSAESIPLPSGSLDVVTVAQAWHWFDSAVAVPEIARVLRPGGLLSIVWNVRDTQADWVAALGEILHRGDPLGPAGGHPLSLGDGLDPSLFGPVDAAEVRWEQTLTPATLRTLAASRSYLLTLEPDRREELLGEVDRLTATHPSLRGRDTFGLPYVATCFRTRRTTEEPR